MMQTYELFYKQHGIRLAQQLPSPPVSNYLELQLPRNSVFHWFGYEHSEQIGLSQNDQIAKNVEKNIYARNIEHYEQLDIVGNPRNIPIMTSNMTRDYFKKNKRIKLLKNTVNDIKDDRCLIVYNYGLLNDHYRYTGSITVELDRWLNYHRTVYNTIAKLTKESNRHHFVEIDVPTIIPPLTSLLAAENGLDKTTLRKLTTTQEWQVSEFFNLIATNYHAYIFKDIANDRDALNLINIIFKSGNDYTVLNLGRLFMFMDAESGSRDEVGDGVKMRIGKRFLKAMITLRSGMNLDTMNVTGSDAGKNLANSLDDIIKEDKTQDMDEEDENFNTKQVAPSYNPDKDPFAQFKSPGIPETVPAVNLTDDDKEIPEDNDIDTQIDAELKELEEINRVTVDNIKAYNAYKEKQLSGEEAIILKAKEFANVGLLSPAEVKRIQAQAQKVKQLPDPRGSNKKLVDSIKISKEELDVSTDIKLVPDNLIGITDKTMEESRLVKFDKVYIDNTLHKDISQMALGIQKAGVLVLDYKIERKKNISDDYEIHRIKVQPVGGKENTISFKVPVVNNDGTFTTSGGRKRLRKQRVSLPICKVAPNEVTLTSYYSKLFITRSERKRFNYTGWLGSEIVAAGINSEGTNILEVKINNVFDPMIKVPRAYSAIAMRVTEITTKDGYKLFFDVNKIEKNVGIKFNNGDNEIAIGKNKKGNIIYLNQSGEVMVDGTVRQSIEEFLGLDVSKRPKDMAEVTIFSKDVPLVLVLAYQIGLGNLLETLGVKYRHGPKIRTPMNQQLQEGEAVICFNDINLFYDKSHAVADLLLGGFQRLYKSNKNVGFSIYDFDKPSIYHAVFEQLGIPGRYLKELPLMYSMWVDHITEEILKDMGEPTDLVHLFIRAAELLTNDEHPDANDIAFMRDRGYERISGMVYSELITSLRQYNAKPLNKNNTIELHPDAVWYDVLQDQSVVLTEESNPIHELKEQEIVVARGAGGRSSLSMTAKDRSFHKNGLGLVSEATVDNSETGTITYTTFNPNYKSVRGISSRVDLDKKINPSELVSTSMLNAPGSEKDDAKRCVFIGVQNSSTTLCHNYTTLPVRTGMERVIAGRCGSMFAATAKDDCVVTKLSKDAISVKYKDGKEESFQLGRRFGVAAGKEYPHEILTDWKVGDKLKLGMTIVYNKYYFEPDPFNKGFTNFKMAMNARVALIEGSDGYEDSSAMSKEMAQRMGTSVGHIRDILLTRDQGLSNLVNIGDNVEPDTILCTIHNEQSESSLFDEETLKSLSILGALNPKAKYKGVVEKIEVFYVPEVDTMSDSLQEVVSDADRRLYKLQGALEQPKINGRVPAGYRVKGSVLSADNIIIRVYITEDLGMGVGDKLVVANQLKSTVGRIWSEPTISEDGKPVDVMFSYQSVDNRIVGSPELIGTTATLLIELGKRVVKAYQS